jgi:hypothetical protein
MERQRAVDAVGRPSPASRDAVAPPSTPRYGTKRQEHRHGLRSLGGTAFEQLQRDKAMSPIEPLDAALGIDDNAHAPDLCRHPLCKLDDEPQ